MFSISSSAYCKSVIKAKSSRLTMIFIPLIFCLAACNSAQSPIKPPPPEFTKMGLSGLIVKKLILKNEKLYAATDQGFYLHESDEKWKLLSNENWDIYDIVVIDHSHFVISYKFRGRNVLSQSTNNGESWEDVRSNFGLHNRNLQSELNEPIFKLFYDDGSLYGSGYDALAISSDFGQHWQKLAGVWNGFARGTSLLTKNTSSNEIWYGGQGAFENPILRRYSETDLSLFEVSTIDDVLPVPSSVKSLVFSELFPNRVYVSGEGGIVYSDDQGDSWFPLLVNEDSRFYFDFAVFQDIEETFYTAGWNKNYDRPQSLIVEVSRDSGINWESFEYKEDELFGGVYSMAASHSESADTLYLGLYKGGVIKVDFSLK